MMQWTPQPLRVLAADDSAMMRGALLTAFELQAREGDRTLPPMVLCGIVSDGLEALEALERLKPDVLLLDLTMPRLDGMGVLLQLRLKANAVPVLLCSSLTEQGARETLEALSLGALDYVAKPSGQSDVRSALEMLRREVMPRVAALAKREQGANPLRPPAVAFPPALVLPPTGAAEVAVIAASTGGPSAIETVLRELPSDFPVPVLIVQHMPRLFTSALAARLDRVCALPVHHAEQGEPLHPGVVYLAPGDAHMEIAGWRGNACVKLHREEPLYGCRPAADFLFRAAARIFGASALAVVMTGMGTDGLEGSLAIHAAGGRILTQDEATSAVWGMPGRVTEAGIADTVLPLERIAGALRERTSACGATINNNMHSRPAQTLRPLEFHRGML